MASPSYTAPAGSIRAPTPAEQQQQQQLPSTGLCAQQKTPHAIPYIASASSPLQNPRVAQLQFSAGSNVSPPGFSNSFPTPAVSPQNSFFVAPAPVNLDQHLTTPATRPPVPPFPKKPRAVPQQPGNMVLEDLQGFGEFSGVNFEGAAFSSPAMASSFDLQSCVSSSSSSNLGTVSPHDLLLQEPIMSAPNSAALTSLTTPSDYNDSPNLEQFDVSPNLGTANGLGGLDQNRWVSLFALDPNGAGAAQQSTGVGVGGMLYSPVSASTDDSAVEQQPSSSSRRKSGHSRSASASAKHSSSAGVSRRREKPLPPIVIDDPNDTVAMKRARNTLAARKSRERKAMRLDELEEEIAKLKRERDHWKNLALGREA